MKRYELQTKLYFRTSAETPEEAKRQLDEILLSANEVLAPKQFLSGMTNIKELTSIKELEF